MGKEEHYERKVKDMDSYTTLKYLELIRKLIADSFYGSAEIKFEKGKIVSFKKVESIKL